MKLGRRILRKLRALMMRTVPGIITCQELEGFMVDYLDGVLPAGQRRKFEIHVRICQDCRHYLEKYKGTISLSRMACHHPDGKIPEDVPEELVQAILAVRDEDP